MFNLGDEVIYKNIKGVVIDDKNQVVYNNANKYYIDFSKSYLSEASSSLFEDKIDLEIYLEFVEQIDGETIDARK